MAVAFRPCVTTAGDRRRRACPVRAADNPVAPRRLAAGCRSPGAGAEAAGSSNNHEQVDNPLSRSAGNKPTNYISSTPYILGLEYTFSCNTHRSIFYIFF